jgi:hypothetical protein
MMRLPPRVNKNYTHPLVTFVIVAACAMVAMLVLVLIYAAIGGLI